MESWICQERSHKQVQQTLMAIYQTHFIPGLTDFLAILDVAV